MSLLLVEMFPIISETLNVEQCVIFVFPIIPYISGNWYLIN